MSPYIISHRGLEPSKENFYPESSLEAFEDQLQRGFGIEFDPNFVKDGIVINHDVTLTRISKGNDGRNFSDITVKEATTIRYGDKTKGRMPTFDELMNLVRKSSAPIHALHLKGKFQAEEFLDRLVAKLEEYEDLVPRLVIFDAKPETARYLKKKNASLVLAPSVANPYDVIKYNSVVFETLITTEDAIRFRNEGLFEWVWLDEWALSNENHPQKIFYNEETFGKLKNVGYKIALVTPELHATSPGLLSGESHPDAASKEKLFTRIQEIIGLSPDAVCTDYPEEVRSLLG